jgi:large subunit ribosomal protein L10
MARKEKAVTLETLEAGFRDSSATLLTEYRGLSVGAMKKLRRSLGAEVSYTVAKNTLMKLAAKRAGVDGLDDMLKGPSALAFVKGDAVNAAKAIKDFSKENPLLVIKGGFLDGKVLTAKDVQKLADLESREVLLAKLAGAMKAKMAQAAALFAAPASKTVRTIDALRVAATANPSLIAGAGAAPAVAAPEAATETPAPEAPAEVADVEASEAPAAEAAETTEG